MNRLVGATFLYALLAALLLAAPLAASEQPPEAQPPPQQAVVGTVTPAAEPEAPVAEPEALTADPVEPPADPAAPEPAGPPQPAAEPARPEPKPKPRPVVAKAASGTVTISDFQFAPASITIDVGDTVTWSNAGPTPHSATADSFDTGIFEEGQTRSETFEEAGEFAYICTPHPNMKGTVIVRAAAAQSEDDGGSADAGSGAAADEDSTASDTAPSTGSADVATLPATGIDSGGLLVLGLVTLVLGAIVRRRTSATE